MKSQGHKSIRRAISMDRLSASFSKIKRYSADMSMSPESNSEGGSAGVRTTSHRISHTEFLNWIAYCRDLSPEITEDQRRTCPVCETSFRDRTCMLKHIPSCSKLSLGYYRCIQCRKWEKIGRYHSNGCREIHNQENYESTQAPWERSELQSVEISEMDTAQHVPELVAESRPTELDNDLSSWSADANYGWQYGPPVSELSGWSAASEMPVWEQPQELDGNGYESTGNSFTSPCSEELSPDSLESTPSSVCEINQTFNHTENPAIAPYDLFEDSFRGVAGKNLSSRPSLRVNTSNREPQVSDSLEIHQIVRPCHDNGLHHPSDQFLAFPERQTSEIDFLSSPTSPTPYFDEHDDPVSPIENGSRPSSASGSTIFSSLSSSLMDDIVGSLSSVESSDSKAQARILGDDVEMCLEPESIDDYTISTPDGSFTSSSYSNYYSNGYSNGPSTAVSSPEMEGEGDLLMSIDGGKISTDDADPFIHKMNAKANAWMSEYFSRMADGKSLQVLQTASTPEVWQSGENLDAAESLNINAYSSCPSLTGSETSSPRADYQNTSASLPNRSSPFIEDLNEDPNGSLKIAARPPLSRAPAFRAVYRCKYDSCNFQPTGKRAYHKRTLQRHEEKCLHAPSPPEKKPCKCTFPGCSKGFSRGDGLNVHRKKTGHDIKFEVNVDARGEQACEVEGYF